MALQKKKYRCSKNRSRGGVKGKNLDTSSAATGKPAKHYDKQMKSCHGGMLDELTDRLHEQLKRQGLRV